MFDPRRHAVRPDLADSRLADLLPEDHAVVDGALEQVSAPVVPIFAQPDARAERASEALLGERVMVFEDRDGFSWCQLQADGTVGYIPTAALSPDIAAPSHRLGALRSFVYATSDLHGTVSAALSMGSEVRVEEQDGDFSRIGPDEWVFTGHLLAADDVADDPVTVAAMFLHTPYLRGGRSSLGLDCSALVQRAFAACGRALPRDSDMQAGDALDWLDDSLGADWQEASEGAGTALQRCDLLFWDGHVGLMVDEKHLIHASADAMAVVTESMAQAVARIEAAGAGLPTLVRRPI
ncbi:MAG: hypothetical protein CME02_07765 [Geminicoccus sp.]|nr:hypothetical protein [Geminicoccus sp.]